MTKVPSLARMTRVAALAAAALAGCGTPRPTSFEVRMSDMGYMVKFDDSYRAIPIESAADREWFDGQLRALYGRRIGKAEFIADGDRRFPGYAPSWRRLADLFGS